ncbi:RNA-directed DNA polymerase (Reverse transcriptase) [Desulfofundulus kuznetsovii DSM 6115]|uniref:RNA-directed DNA polymerase n=2 Tax=Desulfofundulus kuznetsovii TaxID=58135 RepID=A0AAU8P9W9_DESK7|nr:RNA-directed DNA polymerase (Reverse transcriptase) [Desulfofundulus kuznetsovii DSM 6115]
MRSREGQRQQKTPEGACPREEVVKPRGTAGGPSPSPAQSGTAPRGDRNSGLMEQVVARENMLAALKRVERNGGAPGVDGIPTERLRDQIRAEWPRIREELLAGTYRPMPVRRVEIPKPGGGKRLLGIPTAMDRLIQQALLQVLTPIFDPQFSEASYGFRPGRRAHDAVRKARQYVEEGYEWAVDLDIEKFFDRVNHDILMARVARKVTDKRVLTLIRRYLQAGVMVNGVVMETAEGTPQGGPLSPLLANILLDDLDKELEKRGHKFVRYADDCNIYVKSKRAGERVMASIRKFLQERLKLRINEQKSAVDRPWKLKFLGFSMYKAKAGRILIRLAPQTIKRVKMKIREITSRNKPVSMAERIERLNAYLGGWMGYFALAETPSIFKNLEGWMRRRLRMCLWKQWKRVRTRYRELRALGLPEWVVHEFANARKGPWRMAHGPMNRALGNAYWQSQGLMSLTERYSYLRQAW